MNTPVAVTVWKIILRDEDCYALLKENGGRGRIVPVFVALKDAPVLLSAAEGLEAPSLGFFNITVRIIKEMRLNIEKLLVSRLEQGVLSSHLFLSSADGNHVLPAKISEGLALALFFGSPMEVSAAVWDRMNDEVDMADLEEFKDLIGATDEEWRAIAPSLSFREVYFASYGEEMEKLQKMLSGAVRDERFEEAARLRDQLRRLKSFKALKEQDR